MARNLSAIVREIEIIQKSKMKPHIKEWGIKRLEEEAAQLVAESGPKDDGQGSLALDPPKKAPQGGR